MSETDIQPVESPAATTDLNEPARDDRALMTDAERAAFDDDGSDEAGKPAAADPPPADDIDPVAAAAIANEPDEPAASEMLEAARALREATANELARAMAAAATALPDPAPAAPPRDYDTELEALDKKYDDGDLELADWRRQTRDIERGRAEEHFSAKATAEAQQVASAIAERDWNQHVTQFVKRPGMDVFLSNVTAGAAFQAAINTVAAAGETDYATILEKAAAQVFETFGVKAPTPADPAAAAAAIAAATAARRPKPDDLPAANIGTAPAAGGEAGKGGFEQLDTLDISDLEDHLARLPPDKLDAYLSSAPGGLKDHPRGQ